MLPDEFEKCPFQRREGCGLDPRRSLNRGTPVFFGLLLADTTSSGLAGN